MMGQRYPQAVTVAQLTPAYVRAIGYVGGVYGDDTNTATANVAYATNSPAPETGVFVPKTQAEKATLPGGVYDAVQTAPLDIDYVPVTDITQPRGYIGPQDSYAKAAPSAPTITSLAPSTVAAGSPSPLAVIVTGTNFTQWTTLETGGVPSPYVQYNSPTKLTILMDPARSVPGVVVVKVVDHGVASAGTNFTYT